jgi:hypothetical protein
MKQKPGQLKTHRHAQKLVAYLRTDQPATVAAIVLAGLMTSREARGGVQYGIRHGMIERVKRPGAAYNERTGYRLTGRSLPAVIVAEDNDASGPSFDALLDVWGIAPLPPPMPTHAPGRIITFGAAHD